VVASHDESEVYHEKMTATNEILLPILLFIVYFFFSIQFLSQYTTSMLSDRPKVIVDRVNTVVVIENQEVVAPSQLPITIFQERGSADPVNAVISREWLETQSLANLKAIVAELCITPIGDKRSRLVWIDAIASTTPTTPENTALAVNLCYA
jgi:hypothetical protein